MSHPSFDYSRDIAQLGELQQLYQQAPVLVRNTLESTMAALADVIREKAKRQKELLEKAQYAGPLSPEELRMADKRYDLNAAEQSRLPQAGGK